jgi:hypothetical protein
MIKMRPFKMFYKWCIEKLWLIKDLFNNSQNNWVSLMGIVQYCVKLLIIVYRWLVKKINQFSILNYSQEYLISFWITKYIYLKILLLFLLKNSENLLKLKITKSLLQQFSIFSIKLCQQKIMVPVLVIQMELN